MDSRAKWLDGEGETATRDDESTAVKIGARAERRQIAFFPNATNREFNGGMGKSLEYVHLLYVDFALDFSELVLTFTSHRITIRGRNLKGLFDQIASHIAGRVEEAIDDPMQAKANPLRFTVTRLALEALAEVG